MWVLNLWGFTDHLQERLCLFPLSASKRDDQNSFFSAWQVNCPPFVTLQVVGHVADLPSIEWWIRKWHWRPSEGVFPQHQHCRQLNLSSALSEGDRQCCTFSLLYLQSFSGPSSESLPCRNSFSAAWMAVCCSFPPGYWCNPGRRFAPSCSCCCRWKGWRWAMSGKASPLVPLCCTEKWGPRTWNGTGNSPHGKSLLPRTWPEGTYGPKELRLPCTMSLLDTSFLQSRMTEVLKCSKQIGI